MSLVLLANTCSHLQNASLARLGLTSVPLTNQLHALLLQLQKHGYVNTVAIAGPTPPVPTALAPVMSLHRNQDDEYHGLEEGGVGRDHLTGGGRGGGMGDWDAGESHVAPRGDPRFSSSSLSSSSSSPSSTGSSGGMGQSGGERGFSTSSNNSNQTHQITQSNISTRRLWIGLKYHNHRPVLSRLSMISKPTRRYWMGVADLDGLRLGEKRGHVAGLRGVGETMFVSSDRGVMDLRECVERKVGGMLLCRVNGI